MNNIIRLLNNNIRAIVLNHLSFFENDAYEIRLRINSPIIMKSLKGDYYLDFNNLSGNYNDSYYKLKKKDIDETVASLTLNSIHAYEKELINGYITIEGGHRVGISGDCIYNKENLRGFKNITSLNIRIAKEFYGCSEKYLKYFIYLKNKVYNSLIIGPPISGKTTLIRDIAAHLSDGIEEPFFEGCDITLIDERGEIASVFNGVAQLYVGRRTDVLSYCFKSDGFMMSIRSLSPKVIISDELGSKDDFEAIQYALKSGVSIITTAHGYSLEDVKKNIYLKHTIENNFFDRAVILKDGKTPSSIKEIYDFTKNRMIFNDNN